MGMKTCEGASIFVLSGVQYQVGNQNKEKIELWHVMQTIPVLK